MSESRGNMPLRIHDMGLHVCCIQLIVREGQSARVGDTLNCDMCLTRLIFEPHPVFDVRDDTFYGEPMWQWDTSAEWPPTPPLPLKLPPPGVQTEDPPEGVKSSQSPAPGGSGRTMIGPKPKPPPVSEPVEASGVKLPDQQE